MFEEHLFFVFLFLTSPIGLLFYLSFFFFFLNHLSLPTMNVLIFDGSVCRFFEINLGSADECLNI
jgi:hypothetical protein